MNEKYRKHFKNVPAEIIYNPTKEFYTTMNIDGTSHLVTFKGQKVEAKRYFKKVAKANNTEFNANSVRAFN